MNATLTNIAAELTALARERGWLDIARLAESACAAEPRQLIAVVRFLDANAKSLADWIRGIIPSAKVVELDGGSDRAAAEGWLADQLVALFPCGGMPTTEVLQGLASGPFSRPAGTWAVVLAEANQISSAEDLELVETTARKWLLPPAPSVQAAADLADAGAYLWTDAPLAGSDLGARLAHDSAALIHWLTSPLSLQAVAELQRLRLGQALDQAAEEDVRSLAISNLDRRRFFLAAEDLDAVRSRVLARLRSDIGAQNEALRVAVDDLETDLLNGLNPYLASYLARSPDAANSEQAVRQMIGEYCTETLDRWENSRVPRLIDQWQSAICEIEQLIREADWNVVNETADAAGAYPDRLLQRLASEPWRAEYPTTDVSTCAAVPDVPGIMSASGIIKTAGAGLLGCLAGALTGFGPAGVAVGGGLATAASVGHQLQSSRAAAHAAVLDCARQVIIADISATRAHLMEHLEKTTDSLTQNIAGEFDRAEARLNKNQSSPTAPTAASSQRLVELRANFNAHNV